MKIVFGGGRQEGSWIGSWIEDNYGWTDWHSFEEANVWSHHDSVGRLW